MQIDYLTNKLFFQKLEAFSFWNLTILKTFISILLIALLIGNHEGRVWKSFFVVFSESTATKPSCFPQSRHNHSIDLKQNSELASQSSTFLLKLSHSQKTQNTKSQQWKSMRDLAKQGDKLWPVEGSPVLGRIAGDTCGTPELWDCCSSKDSWS